MTDAEKRVMQYLSLDDLRALLSTIAELRADATRYRFLRDKARESGHDGYGLVAVPPFHAWDDSHGSQFSYRGATPADTLDNAVDAAIAENEGGKVGSGRRVP